MLLSDPITCHTGPLQEVAKLLLAGGKGGDQVLSGVYRHDRAHLEREQHCISVSDL